jgi:hypothetical protein
MVVVVVSTSTNPRKNRRTLSKKKKKQSHLGHEINANPTIPSPDDEILIDVDTPDVAPPTEAPSFGPAPPSTAHTSKSETRRVPIPPHRMTPLKKDWINIFGPLTEMLGLQVRMNAQRKCVEMRVRPPILPFAMELR